MPKKAQSRSARARARPRQPPAAPAQAESTPPGVTVTDTSSTTVATRTGAPTASTRSAGRRPTAPRTVVTTVFNYTNLVSDIKTLSVIAPSMVVLLVIAYFVLR